MSRQDGRISEKIAKFVYEEELPSIDQSAFLAYIGAAAADASNVDPEVFKAGLDLPAFQPETFFTSDISSSVINPTSLHHIDVNFPVGTHQILAEWSLYVTAASGSVQTRAKSSVLSGGATAFGRRLGGRHQTSPMLHVVHGITVLNSDVSIEVGSPALRWGSHWMDFKLIVTSPAVMRFEFTHLADPTAPTTGKFFLHHKQLI